MEFLKKHYEKVLLSVVLLGLGAVAYWLPNAVREAETTTTPPPPQSARSKSNSIPPITFERELAALDNLTNPPVVTFSGEHRVLNPATWKKMPDGSIKKFLSEGVESLVIKTNHPLYLVISLDRSSASGFYITVQQQAKGERNTEFLKVNDKSKTKLFTVTEARGDTNEPSEVIIEMPESDPVSLKKGSPYQKVEGYSTDLKYDLESKQFSDRRVGQLISFGGETYKIIYIGPNSVSLIDQATGKQTTIGTP